jgi:hypothetical protein
VAAGAPERLADVAGAVAHVPGGRAGSSGTLLEKLRRIEALHAEAGMARLAQAADLPLYRAALDTWIPKAEIRPPAKPVERCDGVVAWRTAGETVSRGRRGRAEPGRRRSCRQP